ncbi:jg10630 [Pararge aegeria aegeria]|uniref:Jg10630 protein n=1 Tax=Pararge aegeria aegeria TaxID=348720 RepID=A0A8S4RAF0_9NEOP|nr:jg10630 [Pararge aegeria aegeria]
MFVTLSADWFFLCSPTDLHIPDLITLIYSLQSSSPADQSYSTSISPEDAPLSERNNDIIATKVIEVSVGDDGELQLADSELTASSSDSEMDLHDYWLCAHCRAQNNNPMYRYCEKCFKERKNFFPPRPKRKHRRIRSSRIEPEPLPRTLSQDSGLGSVANSQELSQNDFGHSSQNSMTEFLSKASHTSTGNTLIKTHLKRRAESGDRYAKRIKTDYSDSESANDSDTFNSKCNAEAKSSENLVREKSMFNNNIDVKTVSDSEVNINKLNKSILIDDVQVTPLVKMISDPALTVENTDVKLTKKAIINTIKEKLDIESKDLCIICFMEPKSGVFVHGRIAHICCCYKCAVKVWSKAKRCPVCNCKVSNVLKAVVM